MDRYLSAMDRYLSAISTKIGTTEGSPRNTYNLGAVFRPAKENGNTSKNSELDLAGLVCNNLGDHTCINPQKGQIGGDTWEYRSGFIDGMMKGRQDVFGDLGGKLGE